jgi:hypothetical protein
MEETSGTTHHICTEYYNATSDDRWNRCGDQIDYDAGDVLPDLATEALAAALSGYTREWDADELDGTPHRYRLALYAGHGEGWVLDDAAPIPDLSDLDPVGATEIAERLSVALQTVGQWRLRGVMPAPTWTVGGRPAWAWPIIEQWARDTGRLPSGVS